MSTTATDDSPIIVPYASPVYTASAQGNLLDYKDQCWAVPVNRVSSPALPTGHSSREVPPIRRTDALMEHL